MFLDENGVPFTGGTYFPPKEMYGRPSFVNILNQVSEFYSKNRDKVIEHFVKLESLLNSFDGDEMFDQIHSYIQNRLKNEIEQIKLGENKEIEKRYQRYIDYG